VANDGRSRRQYIYNPQSQLLQNREPVGLSIPQLELRIGTPKSATERVFCSTERPVKTTSGKKSESEKGRQVYIAAVSQHMRLLRPSEHLLINSVCTRRRNGQEAPLNWRAGRATLILTKHAG
jgi:hypothetical protein